MRSLIRCSAALLTVVALGSFALPGRVHAQALGQVMTSKSIPKATVQVIDPESGTSSGGASSEVRIAEGDIILFRFNYFPVPDKIVRGIQGYLTEYVPANTEVVGFRLIDDQGRTIPPRYPGVAEDGCGGSCGGFNSVPCSDNDPDQPECTGGTRDLPDGRITQVYADTGLFYASDSLLNRIPSNEFLTLTNGILMNPEPVDVEGVARLIGGGKNKDRYAHNHWDWDQVLAYGVRNNASGTNGTGNTPYLYGSPVAGPETFYRYEASDVGSSTIEFNDDVGPWNRIRYSGSLIGTGSSGDGPGIGRSVQDASGVGHDLKPANPLPAKDDANPTTALRAAVGQIRVGHPGQAEVALRVKDVPLDPGQNANVDCSEVHGGDASSERGGEDNPWGRYIASPACVFLKLKFDLNVDQALARSGETLRYTLDGKNLSLNAQHNTTVRIRYDTSQQSFVSASPTPDDNNASCGNRTCLVWNLGTLEPSEEIDITADFSVGGAGAGTNVLFADFDSDEFSSRYETKAISLVRDIARPEASLTFPDSSVSPGGTASPTSGTLDNTGTADLQGVDLTLHLPTNWTIVEGSLSLGGSQISCSSGCDSNEPTFSLADLVAGSSQSLDFEVNVPGGAASGLYDIGVQVWGGQSQFGGRYETFFPEIGTVAVAADRSDVPSVDCPVKSTETEITGTTSEGECAIATVYLNGIPRETATADANGEWTVSGFGEGTSFGTLYGGLEVRATVQADPDCNGTPDELESRKSPACFVTATTECQDGIDNDGDGVIDFPADDGCTSFADRTEGDAACNDGIDNDGDGLVDAEDPGCVTAHDNDESDDPRCNDGIDNDGDGDTDYPADSGCSSPSDQTEVELAACMDGEDNDDDGKIDYPNDPGCHSRFDDTEAGPFMSTSSLRARIMLVHDTSGSMNWNTCEEDSFTDGDGSNECPGNDVLCDTCDASDCGNATPDDSRLFKAKEGIRNAVTGFGEVQFGLMRFHQRREQFACPTSNASLQSGGWQGSGAAPCSGGFNAGDLLVDFSRENQLDLLAWMDNDDGYPGSNDTPPPGFDRELRGTGTTPIAGSLDSARSHLVGVESNDPKSSCRPYEVILVTDGNETCGGDPQQAAADLFGAGFPVHVIGFAVDEQGAIDSLNAIADAGGTDSAIFVTNETELSTELASIVSDTVVAETCNQEDDDCDGKVDEGFELFCNKPEGEDDKVLCSEPAEQNCDGVDDDCDGKVDEGLLNACGNCGTPSEELCGNNLDDDCDGAIDETTCDECVVQPEICDNVDDDCDGAIDENLTRTCSTDVGFCEQGEETCTNGSWGECSGKTPKPEECNNVDDNCDGVVDSFSVACGNGTGVCQQGTKTCTNGTFGDCEGTVGGSSEACDGLDNDCDGTIDEDVPGVGDSCGTDVGACQPGTKACMGGEIVCMNSVPPTSEVCDGIDNDCDGTVDDGLGVGAACGTNTGQCQPGHNVCEDGETVCQGGVQPTDETCDGLDNDCDGTIDEALPIGGECGTGEGICKPGTFQCVDGEEICVGAVPEAPETCDCEDNDCDEAVDEQPANGSLCPGESQCLECQCAVPCRDTVEFGKCPGGRVPEQIDGQCFCIADPCDPSDCAEQTVEIEDEVKCGPGDDVPDCTCKSGDCTFPCQGVQCGEGTACKPDTGECVIDDCRGLGCPDGEMCDVAERECVPNPCASADCDAACRVVEGEAQCEPSCAGKDCDEGQTCERGECTEDPCAEVSCASTEVCDPDAGECVESQCAGVRCPPATVCNPLTGDCPPDPCLRLTCPEGEMCREGECALPSPDTDGGVPDAGGGFTDGGPSADAAARGDADERRVVATGGGGCACHVPGRRQTGSSSEAPWMLGVLVGAAVAWRRRRSR